MIAWPVLSWNACNTSHLMGIRRTKRSNLRIPSIGEHTYTILFETVQSVVQLFKTQCCFLALSCMCTHQYLEFDFIFHFFYSERSFDEIRIWFPFFQNTKIKKISQIISSPDNLIMEPLSSQCQNFCENQILAIIIHHWDRFNLKLDYLFGMKSAYDLVFCLQYINKYRF